MVYTVGSDGGLEDALTTKAHLDDGPPPVQLAELFRTKFAFPAIGIPLS